MTRSPLRPAAVARALGTGVAAVAVLLGVLALFYLAAGAAAYDLDTAILAALIDRRTEAGVEMALDLTALGNTLTLAVLVAWCGAGLWLAGRRDHAATLALAFLGGRLVTELAKAAFHRPRPDLMEWGVHVTSAAYPSAHAMSAAVVYGALAWLVGNALPRPARVAAWVLAALLVTVVATSRVYLGVHYPSDVIAGAAAGALWVATVVRALAPQTPRLRGG